MLISFAVYVKLIWVFVFAYICTKAGFLTTRLISRGAKYDDFSSQYFDIFEIIIFCSVVAICDLVHDVEAMYGLP